MQEIQRKNCIFMHFCTFISHFNMSKSVSAVVFSAPQLHYDFFALLSCGLHFKLFFFFCPCENSISRSLLFFALLVPFRTKLVSFLSTLCLFYPKPLSKKIQPLFLFALIPLGHNYCLFCIMVHLAFISATISRSS